MVRKSSVYAARLDLDETGGGNVDAFVMPVRVNGRTGKRTILTSKALREVGAKHGERMSYVAVQTDWSDYAREHLDPAIMRGTSRAKTLIDHLGVEEYNKAAHIGGEAQSRRSLSSGRGEPEIGVPTDRRDEACRSRRRCPTKFSSAQYNGWRFSPVYPGRPVCRLDAERARKLQADLI